MRHATLRYYITVLTLTATRTRTRKRGLTDKDSPAAYSIYTHPRPPEGRLAFSIVLQTTVSQSVNVAAMSLTVEKLLN